jgi:hypothetical protein
MPRYLETSLARRWRRSPTEIKIIPDNQNAAIASRASQAQFASCAKMRVRSASERPTAEGRMANTRTRRKLLVDRIVKCNPQPGDERGGYAFCLALELQDRSTDLPDGQITEFPVQPPLQKYSAFPVGQIISTSSPRPVPQRGGSRSSRTRGGMRWTRMRS